MLLFSLSLYKPISEATHEKQIEKKRDLIHFYSTSYFTDVGSVLARSLPPCFLSYKALLLSAASPLFKHLLRSKWRNKHLTSIILLSLSYKLMEEEHVETSGAERKHDKCGKPRAVLCCFQHQGCEGGGGEWGEMMRLH